MIDFFPVEVECVSNFRSEEYPQRFYLENMCFIVEEIVDIWYQVFTATNNPDSINNFQPANYYKVNTTGQKIYILKQETESREWFLLIKGEHIILN